MTNEELYEKAKKAVMDLFSDTSVSQGVTHRQLQALIDEIAILQETLEEEERDDEDSP